MNLEQVLGTLRKGGKITNTAIPTGPFGPAQEGIEVKPAYVTFFGEGEEKTLIQVRNKAVQNFNFNQLSNEDILGDGWSVVE